MIKNDHMKQAAVHFARTVLAEASVSVGEAVQITLKTLQELESLVTQGNPHAPAQVEYLQACLQELLDQCTEEMAVL